MHYTNDVGLDFGDISKSILNVPCTSGQGLVYVKYVISFKINLQGYIPPSQSQSHLNAKPLLRISYPPRQHVYYLF